jgi:outer membrane protein TolC
MVPSDDDALVATALRERPEVAVQDATIAREQRMLELARKAILPDVELSVSRFINAGDSDGFGAMAAVTLPIANKPKYDAAISEANARIVSAEADRRRVEDAIRRDVEQAWLRLRTAALSHDLQATTHLPHAEITLQVTESAYMTGRVDLMALLDTVRGLQMVHLEHVDSAAEIELEWADLERAVGGTMPATEVSDG